MGRQRSLFATRHSTITGYYRAPEHNARAFTAQGFYRTGDNVRLDEAGNLHVEGRIKEQINRAGEKIAAAEVESVLMRLEDVKDCAVVAAPDTLLGERICAFIIAQRTPSDYQQLRQKLVQMGIHNNENDTVLSSGSGGIFTPGRCS